MRVKDHRVCRNSECHASKENCPVAFTCAGFTALMRVRPNVTKETACLCGKYVFRSVHLLQGRKAFSKCPKCGAFVDIPLQDDGQ